MNMAKSNVFIAVSIFQLLIFSEAAPRPDQLGEEPLSDLINVCTTSACNDSALRISDSIDLTNDPCDDFYQFACGGYLKENVIPKGRGGISKLSTLQDRTYKQVKYDLESTIEDGDSRPWKMTKKWHQLCLDTATIDKESEQEILDLLKNVGGWPIIEGESWNESAFRWENLIYQLRDMGDIPNYFFNLDLVSDPSNHRKNILQISPPEPGLYSKYLYRKTDTKMVMLYSLYIGDLAKMLGADSDFAWAEVKKIVDFEVNLVEHSFPSDPVDNATEHLVTVKELEAKYANIPWMEYINEFLKPHTTIQPDDEILIQNQRYFEGFSKLLETTPKRLLADYAIWRFVQGTAPYLSERIRITTSDFTRRATATSKQAREDECLTYTFIFFSAALSSHYLKNHFDVTSKNMAQEMVTNIRTSLQEILEEVEWMDSSTRANALKKLDWMIAFVGYPDELSNDEIMNEYYKNLTLDDGSFFKSLLNYGKFNNMQKGQDYRRKSKRNDWDTRTTVTVVNAAYRPRDNAINIPAGILQGTLFSKERPDYLNYGAIGWIVGHEITHGFDTEGSKYDKKGALVDWWDPETKEKFLERTNCMIEQYNSYRSEQVSMNLNGTNTIGENIADNGGLKEAYHAYNKREQQHGIEPGLPGLPYTPKQLFWISAANVYCGLISDANLKNNILTDVHAPGYFRVIGTLSNMPEFAKDFSCPVGSRMNPVKKCTVW